MIEDPVLVNEWHPVLRSDSLADGQVRGARLLGEDLVLWRSNGRVLAWRDLCVHRGTRLSLGRVEQGCLVCPYHGWTYDETGRCVRIPAHPEQAPPAKATAKAHRAAERSGLVWVSPGEPDHEVPGMPEEGDRRFRLVLSGPFGPIAASAPRVVENFLDIAHFPFVHGGTLGDPRHPEITDYEAEVGPDGIAADDVVVYQPDPYGTGSGDRVSYSYRVPRPLVAYFTKAGGDSSFSGMLFVTPHDAVSTTAWVLMALTADIVIPDDELVSFQAGIVAQDVTIVESQRPELLPLDLQAELHLRSDRLAIAYRGWLRELGLSFGTA
jgi:phenylpropionate dioxygenase-like ring-hydroxylating dioxygenase large terminal subunit